MEGGVGKEKYAYFALAEVPSGSLMCSDSGEVSNLSSVRFFKKIPDLVVRVIKSSSGVATWGKAAKNRATVPGSYVNKVEIRKPWFSSMR